MRDLDPGIVQKLQLLEIFQVRNPGGRNSIVKRNKLVHQPGAGATTVAMAVLWKLRKEFRCVKIDCLNRDHLTDIADNIIGKLP